MALRRWALSAPFGPAADRAPWLALRVPQLPHLRLPAAGRGIHIKNLYNSYVYFWRWALWKLFETTDEPAIVSFITASSYLRGPGFVGMRQVMRETFDDLWIIDLEGDNRGARKTENVFDIETPVAIAVGVRYGSPQPTVAADVHYSKIVGSREDKLARLAAISSFAELEWEGCFTRIIHDAA